MIKSGKTPLQRSDDDVITISYIAARIAVKLQKIKKTYRTPKKYTEKGLKLLEHKKNIAASFIIFDFDNMDPERLYKPSEIKNDIIKYMQSDMLHDTNDLVAALGDKSKGDYVTSKDISKALKILEKEIGLINIKGKEKIKNIRGKQKIEFLGNPSLYKLPPDSMSLKRVLSEPKTFELIFITLIKMGLLSHLKFILEASFYAIRDQNKKQRVYDLAKVASKQIHKPKVKVEKSRWESYRTFLMSVPEDQLKIIAGKFAEYTSQYPTLYCFILLLALYESE